MTGRRGRLSRTVGMVAVAGALLGVAAACGGDDDAAPAGRESASDAGDAVTITLSRLEFDPAELSVPAGTTVTWRSAEPIGHTVTSGTVTGVDPTSGLRSGEKADGRFDADLKGKGDTFTYTFTTPGTYSYFCSIHQGMHARITVT